jgi:Peptidase family M28
MPITGAVASLSATFLYLGRGMPWLIAIAVTIIALMGGALVWLGGNGVLDFPLMRRRAVNLEAVRGDAPPSVWLVAHIDSKWQPVSMIARVAGVVGTTAGISVLFALAIVRAGRADAAAVIVLILTWVFSVPLLMSVVEARNTGALDNASGVSAVLAAATLVPQSARVGVVITDAEELALAGSRAWVAGRAASVALNCDSIDDAGQLTVMYSRRRPDGLVSHFVRAGATLGERVRVMRLIPGVLTDSVALADAGWQTVTLSRGNLRTLQRIHTSRDTLETMRGTGLDAAARLLADTATELG